ncbi:hypothetical protein V500_03012 [Pseudogymnoascus sp. VKM F-4518 (FW-2643)]|nr:hypothetical protein V500_03012 [Pseudogymnoascus sp. VKM F-4518 (FW-2643)]
MQTTEEKMRQSHSSVFYMRSVICEYKDRNSSRLMRRPKATALKVSQHIGSPDYGAPPLEHFRFPAAFFLDPRVFQRGQLDTRIGGLSVPRQVHNLIGDLTDIRAVAANYFENVHPYMCIISKQRFYTQLLNPLSQPRPENALLLLCVRLITLTPSPSADDPPMKAPLYLAAKSFYAEVEAAGTCALQVLQAGILIALYELAHAIYPQAYLSIGNCARYGVAFGFDGKAPVRANAVIPRLKSLRPVAKLATRVLILEILTRTELLCGVDCDNRRADSGHTIQETGDTRPRPAARRWEDLGRVRVQHTVHDVLEEGLDAGEDELEVGVGADGEEEQTDAREKGRSGHRALAANELDVDGVAGDDGTRDTANRDDGVVAVDNVCWRGRGVGVDAREILGQEGVEQGISHSNRSPAEPQKGSVDSEALVGEERSDALGGELLGLALNNVHRGELLVWDLLHAASYRVENLLADPGLGLVLVGNTSDDGDGLALAATAEQELWRLKQVEEEEAADEHGKGEGSHGEVEISPAHVELLGTARLARADVTTVTQRLVARVVGDEAPGKERSDQLANGPEDTEHGEEVAAGKWQELEEQGTVDWQVAANATSECGVQTADGDPVVGASNRKAENTSHEEGDVECWASSDRVAGNTPKGSTDTQSHEE